MSESQLLLFFEKHMYFNIKDFLWQLRVGMSKYFNFEQSVDHCCPVLDRQRNQRQVLQLEREFTLGLSWYSYNRTLDLNWFTS